MSEAPATPHEAMKAGWDFSRQIDDLLIEYESAMSDLSAKENTYNFKEAELTLQSPEGTVQYKKAWVANESRVQFDEFNTADKKAAALKVLLEGRKQQLSFAMTAISFLKAEWEQARRGNA
ncbi:MAG: hypothetical protein KIT08_01445 [Anaerolineales bacterium]|nr:MAG: hypothetical protein KIT08_01445 [Anaerolineales bacterium]